MNAQACRSVLRDIFMPHRDRRPYPDDYSHPGLLLARCLIEHDSEKEFRRELLRAAQKAQRSTTLLDVYRLAYARWKATLPQPCSSAVLAVNGRLVVGLGAESVLETGIRLHHTYGVPIVPGSALKGLTAHYCDRVWGEADGRFKKDAGEFFKTIFGTTEDAGHIVFHDAWITPESLAGNDSGLVLDVMTPHHGDYYSGNTRERSGGKKDIVPPTDFDDPNPVAFLSVTGRFLVAVSCDAGGPEGDNWSQLALDLLQEALRDWGAGGKTSSGYGRLVRPSSRHGAGAGHSGPSAPAHPKPCHRPGEKIKVTRIEDSKKGKPRFRADDGIIGHFAGEAPPEVEMNASIDVWVANVAGTTYLLTLREPKRGKQSGKSR